MKSYRLCHSVSGLLHLAINISARIKTVSLIPFVPLPHFQPFQTSIFITQIQVYMHICVCVCVHICRLPQWLSGKETICNAGATGDMGSIPGSGRSLEEEMATHSYILAWRIPQTEEPGRLQSMGLQRVRHD